MTPFHKLAYKRDKADMEKKGTFLMSLSTRDDFKERNNYMNISIITRHNIINYGSVMQALALQKILENEGHNAEIIDYIREDEDYRTIAKVLVSRNKKWNSNIFTRMLFVAGKSFEFYFGGKSLKQYEILT